jgi:hypothetical protein
MFNSLFHVDNFFRNAFARVLLAGFIAFSLPFPAHADPIAIQYGPQTTKGITSSGASNTFQIYHTANGWGVTFLEPTVPINPLNYSTSAGTGTLYYNYFNTLDRMYPTTKGWTITGNATKLSAGSLKVTTYGAVGTPREVGADFAVTYRPSTTAPNNDPTNNIHWIQVLSTNNAITRDANGDPMSNPGMNANKVDVQRNNTTSPYYDRGFAANSRGFIDEPRRPDVEFQNNWIASVFLASGPTNPGNAANPATITVYNDSGLLWGWQNFFFPNVNLQQFIQDVNNNVFGKDQLGQVTVNLLLGPANDPMSNPTMTPVTLDLIDPTTYGPIEQSFDQTAQSVPEPSTLVLVCVAGIFGLVGLMRRGAARVSM